MRERKVKALEESEIKVKGRYKIRCKNLDIFIVRERTMGYSEILEGKGL